MGIILSKPDGSRLGKELGEITDIAPHGITVTIKIPNADVRQEFYEFLIAKESEEAFITLVIDSPFRNDDELLIGVNLNEDDIGEKLPTYYKSHTTSLSPEHREAGVECNVGRVVSVLWREFVESKAILPG